MVAISIIVPIYNVEKYLKKCLLSIEKQTFDNFEVILVDDGSNDNSRIIAEQFVKRNTDKFRLICQENQGLSNARNTGILHATGDYICFVDSDDYLDSMYLYDMYQEAKKSNADMVFCAFASVNENGTIIKEIHEQGFVEGEKYSIYDRPDLLLIQNAAWNKMYKKSIILEQGLLFTPNVWYEDLRFVKKFMVFCKSCVYCDKVLYNYLIRPGSIMNSMASDRNLEIISAIKEVKQFYEEKVGKNNRFINEIEFIAIDHMYISASVRLIRAHKNNYRQLINKILYEFQLMFPDFKKNSYISTLDSSRKIIYYLLNYKLYSAIFLIFKFKSKK